ncbi:MAG: hypothetical protein MJZ28_09635 [Paludibacteraceae bacterium]|nr:hypothetical protein [Paludibacteraceae bacterium]
MEILDPEIYQIADEALLELIEKAKVSALSEAEYAQYEAELKLLSNRGTVERYNFEQGRKEGILGIARTMKLNGYPTEEISSLTGLTKEEVEKI